VNWSSAACHGVHGAKRADHKTPVSAQRIRTPELKEVVRVHPRGDGRRDILITVVDEENARRLDVYRGLGTGSFQTPWCECVLPKTLFTRRPPRPSHRCLTARALTPVALASDTTEKQRRP
jgi:hypothetical protein